MAPVLALQVLAISPPSMIPHDSPVRYKPDDSHSNVDRYGNQWFEDRHHDPRHVCDSRGLRPLRSLPIHPGQWRTRRMQSEQGPSQRESAMAERSSTKPYTITGAVSRVLTQPRRGGRCQQSENNNTPCFPQDPTMDALNDLHQMMMVVPIDGQEGETQHVQRRSSAPVASGLRNRDRREAGDRAAVIVITMAMTASVNASSLPFVTARASHTSPSGSSLATTEPTRNGWSRPMGGSPGQRARVRQGPIGRGTAHAR